MGAERALDLEGIIYISILGHQLVGMSDILPDNKICFLEDLCRRMAEIWDGSPVLLDYLVKYYLPKL